MIGPEESPIDDGGGAPPILSRLIELAACAEALQSKFAQERIRTLRQWLALGFGQQTADLRAYLRESGASLKALVSAGTLHDLVPSCAMEAERLWFKSNMEALIAIIRGEDSLQRRPDWRISRILDLAYRNGGASVRLKDLSAELAQSPDHLARRFRSYTGMRMSRYLSLLRMRGALEMLSNPQVTIQEVAFSMGYSAPGSFDRWFQRKFGVSPREFRRQLSSGHARRIASDLPG